MIRRKNKQEKLTGRRPSGSAKTAQVFSYYANRSPAERPEQQARKSNALSNAKVNTRAAWIVYLPSLIALVVVVMCGLYLTTLTTTPKIQVVPGARQTLLLRDDEVYIKAAKVLLERSLTSRSKLIVNTNSVADSLKQQFPELGEVVIEVPLISRRPIIKVQPTTPTLIISGNGGIYVVDDHGRPVIEANQLISSIRDDLPIISDESGTLMEIGQQLVTLEFVQFITLLDAQLEVANISVESYTLPALANELHIRPEGQSYFVKFNTDGDARVQVGTYIAVKEKLDTNAVNVKEYIDVRVEERAYIR